MNFYVKYTLPVSYTNSLLWQKSRKCNLW